MPGQLFVISAPSGAGKSTIISALKNRIEGVGYSISHTSRMPRRGEKDGVDYHFVDRQTFTSMIDAQAFVEWAEVYHNYYGTSFAGLNELSAQGVDVLLDLDVQGAKNIRKHFKDSALICILPPSLEVLETRLKERDTDDAGIIRGRMKKAVNIIKNCVWYDYIIINDDLERAVTEAQAIITSQRCRSAGRMQQVKEMYNI